MNAPCRDFEAAILLRLDTAGTLEPYETSPLASDPHPASCPACAALVADLRIHEHLCRTMRRPEPSSAWLEKLKEAPSDIHVAAEANGVLSLLTPGALAPPEASPELLRNLAFLPMRSRAAVSLKALPKERGFLSRLFHDWRFTVAATYAATFLLVSVLKVDPLSVARNAASSLASSGQRVFDDARTVAEERFKESRLYEAASPLTKRLDYRIYRTVAVSRARAAAYSQLLLDKVVDTAFGSTTSDDDRRGPARGNQRTRVIVPDDETNATAHRRANEQSRNDITNEQVNS